jgi:hypothetical protein
MVMKCFTLCTLVLIAAAGCGQGGDGTRADQRNPNPKGFAQNEVELRAEKAYAAVFGADTAQTCLRAWHDEQANNSGREPVYKPDVAGLRAFLCECVGGKNCPDF